MAGFALMCSYHRSESDPTNQSLYMSHLGTSSTSEQGCETGWYLAGMRLTQMSTEAVTNLSYPKQVVNGMKDIDSVV